MGGPPPAEERPSAGSEHLRSPATPPRSIRPGSTASSPGGPSRTPSIIVDGGDFGSYAGKFVDTETPGCFLDPGPYGCLGTGPGLRPGRPARPPRPPGLPPARRRGRRLLPHRLRHPGRHNAPGGGHRRQQRHLGPGEAPHEGPLRLRRGRRARPGHPLRPGRHRPGRLRRAGRATPTRSAPPSTGPWTPVSPP